MLGELREIVIWGFIATAAMTTLLHGSQGLGLSRLSLPFLVGTMLSASRTRASVLGFLAYLLGGWVFALLYYLVFDSLGLATWWLGAMVGLLHGLFLLVVILPLLPQMHPRMATEYDGPSASRRLEPPGFMGLNYGRRTPLSTLAGQAAYGLILGLCLSVPG